MSLRVQRRQYSYSKASIKRKWCTECSDDEIMSKWEHLCHKVKMNLWNDTHFLTTPWHLLSSSALFSVTKCPSFIKFWLRKFVSTSDIWSSLACYRHFICKGVPFMLPTLFLATWGLGPWKYVYVDNTWSPLTWKKPTLHTSFYSYECYHIYVKGFSIKWHLMFFMIISVLSRLRILTIYEKLITHFHLLVYL